jgi:hypothetical protein
VHGAVHGEQSSAGDSERAIAVESQLGSKPTHADHTMVVACETPSPCLHKVPSCAT